MKAHEALIAWTGWDDDVLVRGTVVVGRFVGEGADDWTARYASTNGSAIPHRRYLRGAASLAELFKDFQYLVVEERIDPEAVHKAFLAIDEYAELFDQEFDGYRI